MKKNRPMSVQVVLSITTEKDNTEGFETHTRVLNFDPESFNFHEHQQKGVKAAQSFLTLSGMLFSPMERVPESMVTPITWKIQKNMSSKEGQELVAEANVHLRDLKRDPPLKETLCIDFSSWVRGIFQARDAGHELTCYDEPMARRLGYIDEVTGELFSISLTVLKQGALSDDLEALLGKTAQEVRRSLCTVEGRELFITGKEAELLDPEALKQLTDIWVVESEKEKPLEVPFDEELFTKV
jgi:hypothetical protein